MPSDRDLAQQLTAELDAWMVRCGGHIQLNNDLLAQHLVAWLSSAGRLVPEGSEVREEWGTDHFGIESGRRVVRLCADLDAAKRRFEDLDEVWGHHAQLIRRTVITTPWTPAQRSGVAAQEES